METRSINDLLKIKREAKDALAKSLKLSKNKPLLGIFLDRELTKTMERRLKVILEGIKFLDVEVVILADSDADGLKSDKLKILPYERMNRIKLLQAADMAMIFSFTDIEELLFNGVIPISGSRPEITDYNPNRETGNSFIYKKEEPWSIFAALVRAVETFKFPYDWKHIVRQGVSSRDSANFLPGM